MILTGRDRYNRAVERVWRGTAVLLLAFVCWSSLAARASADETVNVGPNPVINAQLDSGTLTVKTWDRPTVDVQTDGNVTTHHLDASQVDPRLNKQYLFWSQTVDTPQGAVTLPETSFVLPQLKGNEHDAVEARGSGNTTITVPRGTSLVTASVGSGQLHLNNYSGVFIAHVRDGSIDMNRVNGSGFVEALTGSVNATDSNFDRVRVRTATGNMTFRGCTSHQIEATSTYGSITYDNGRFQPGLARFESVHGNVALGVRGGAQIGAHTGSGHIVSSFHNSAQTRGTANTTQATVRGGGPVVTAVTRNGSVYLYNGSVRAHPGMQAQMRAMRPYGQQRFAPRYYGAPSNNAAPRSYPPYAAPPARQYNAAAPMPGPGGRSARPDAAKRRKPPQ